MIRIGDMVEFTPPQDYPRYEHFPYIGARGIVVNTLLGTPVVQWQAHSLSRRYLGTQGHYDRRLCRADYLTVVK